MLASGNIKDVFVNEMVTLISYLKDCNQSVLWEYAVCKSNI